MPEGPVNSGFTAGAKRVVARPLTPAEAADIPDRRAAMAPEAEVSSPAAPPGVDVTLFGLRRRRHGHQRLYRLIQVAIGVSAAASAVAVACLALEDTLAARVASAAGLALATVAAALGGRTRLSGRATGYAVAAIFVSAVMLAVSTIASSSDDDADLNRIEMLRRDPARARPVR